MIHDVHVENSRLLRSLHTSPVSGTNLLARAHFLNYSWCTWSFHSFPNQWLLKFTPVGRRNLWYKDNVDKNVVFGEALTNVTASTILKLQWVTDQINRDRNNAEENNPLKKMLILLLHEDNTILRTFQLNLIIRQ